MSTSGEESDSDESLSTSGEDSDSNESLYPVNKLYFVIQVPAGAVSIFGDTCTNPFVDAMSLYLMDDRSDVLGSPYSQLEYYGQKVADCDFFTADSTKTAYTKLETEGDLEKWLLDSYDLPEALKLLFVQPKTGFPLTPERIEELKPEWEHHGEVSLDGYEITGIMPSEY